MPTPKDVFFNVTLPPYNADPTGAADATGAIQGAIDAAFNAGGGVVQVPAGQYLIQQPGLTLKPHVRLVGVGNGTGPRVGTPPATTSGGTWLMIYDTTLVPVVMQQGAVLEALGFHHNQPAAAANWAPTVYRQAVQVDGDDCVLREVFLLNCYDGVFVGRPSVVTQTPPAKVAAAGAGRVFIDRVYGQPFHRGIVVYRSLDVARVCNVHFWPYWSGDDRVLAYTRGAGIAVTSHRNDNPHVVNCFAFAYHTGFLFEQQRQLVKVLPPNDVYEEGVTANLHMANCEADHGLFGIVFTSTPTPAYSNRGTPVNHSGQVSNFTMQGGTNIGGTVKGFPGSCGIRTGDVNSCYNRVHCSNVRLSLLDTNGVRVDGTGNQFTFDGLWVDSWNTSGAGWPGVEAAAGSTVVVGETNVLTDGQGAKHGGGAGRVYVAGSPDSRGESVLGGSVTLSAAGGTPTAVPVGFTAPTTGVYLVTVNVRGGINAASANSSVTARLTKSTLPALATPEVQVAWAGPANVLAQATTSRTFRLDLKAGDVIGLEATPYFTGTGSSFVASDGFGRTSLTWEQVDK